MSHHRHLPAAPLPLVMLDAGHGGRDPGAVSGGIRESAIALATVQDLARQLRATRHYRVALTRTSDTFVPLERRVAMTVRSGAALLISVHADASPDRRVRGASVYIRSTRAPEAAPVRVPARAGASRAIARALADPQPRPQAPGQAARLQLAMIGTLDDDVRMLPGPARTARLHVLAAAGVPGVLLEVGFLSNPADEALMRRPAHRRMLARLVCEAVEDVFSGRADPARSRS